MSQVLHSTPTAPDDTPTAAKHPLRAQAPRLEVLSEAERHLLGEWLDRAIDASA
jgi:hypothetical protein